MSKELLNAKEAWKMNQVITAMNNEGAYFNSGWLNVWPDESDYSECVQYFSDDESFNELKDLYNRVFKRYYKDGLYNPQEIGPDALDFAQETLKQLNIAGEFKETQTNLYTVVEEKKEEMNTIQEIKKEKEPKHLKALLDKLNKPTKEDGEIIESIFDFKLVKENGQWFLFDVKEHYTINYEEDQNYMYSEFAQEFGVKFVYQEDKIMPQLEKAIQEDFGADAYIEWEDSVRMVIVPGVKESKSSEKSLEESADGYLGHGKKEITIEEYKQFLNDALEIANKHENSEKVLLSSNTHNIMVPFIGTYGGYVEINYPTGNYDDLEESKIVKESNESEETIESEEYAVEIYCLGKFVRQIDVLSTYEEALKVAKETFKKGLEDKFSSVNITTIFYTNGEETGVDTDFIAGYIDDYIHISREDVAELKPGQELIDVKNDRKVYVMSTDNTPEAIWCSASSSNLSKGWTFSHDDLAFPEDLNEKLDKKLIEEDETVEIEDLEKLHVYQFPNEIKNFMPEFERLCDEHGITFLGKGKNIIDDVKDETPDFFVEGTLKDLRAMADDLDYQLHPDYLIFADDFDAENILIESKKESNESLTEETQRQVNAKRKVHADKTRDRKFSEFSQEELIEYTELSAKDMIISILAYNAEPSDSDETFNALFERELKNRYLGKFLQADSYGIPAISKERLKEIWDDMVKDFKDSEVGFAGEDSEGVRYNYVKYADESLKEAVAPKSEFTEEETNKYVKELTQIFFDEGEYFDIWGDKGIIKANIEWGDWKHQHLYFKSRVQKFFDELNIKIEIDSEVTEEDGSDTYSALYTISKE